MKREVPVVYTKPSCQSCIATKRWLTDAGVPFAELDLTEPEQAKDLEHFKGLGYSSAPITEYRDIAIPGFDPNGLNRIIEAWRADQ